jgi:hypothetical protein
LQPAFQGICHPRHSAEARQEKEKLGGQVKQARTTGSAGALFSQAKDRVFPAGSLS